MSVADISSAQSLANQLRYSFFKSPFIINQFLESIKNLSTDEQNRYYALAGLDRNQYPPPVTYGNQEKDRLNTPVQQSYSLYQSLYALIDDPNSSFNTRKNEFEKVEARIAVLNPSAAEKLEIDLQKSGFLSLWFIRSKSEDEMNYVKKLRGDSDQSFTADSGLLAEDINWKRIESIFPEARKYTVTLPSGYKDILGTYERDTFDNYIKTGEVESAINMLRKLQLRSWTPALDAEKFKRTSILYDLPPDYISNLRAFISTSLPNVSDWDTADLPQNINGKVTEVPALLKPYMTSQAENFFAGTVNADTWIKNDLATLLAPGNHVNEVWYASFGYFHRRLRMIAYATTIRRNDREHTLYLLNALMYAMCLFPNSGNDKRWYRSVAIALGWTLDQLYDSNFEKRKDKAAIEQEREDEKRNIASFIQSYIDMYTEKSRIEGNLLNGPFGFFKNIFGGIETIANYVLIGLALVAIILLKK